MKIFLNGDWLSADQARLPVFDLAILRGYGIFDYLRTYGKHPFRMGDHIARFFRSAKLLGIKPVYTDKEIAEIIHKGIEVNSFENTDIKILQTGGVSSNGFIPDGQPNFMTLFFQAPKYQEKNYENGVSLRTTKVMRQLPEAKTINYCASISEVQKAMIAGAVDVLHTDSQGQIYEGTRSNFFGVVGDKIITAGEGVLRGVTRKVIYEIAKKKGLLLEEKFVNIADIAKLDEAFISNSSQEVMPVVIIDGIQVGSGKVGWIAKMLLAEYRRVASSD